MKKSLIALAVAAGTIAAAQADTTTLYGSLGYSVAVGGGDNVGDILDFGENVWDLNRTTAKMGVKGTEDLSNGTQAFFKYEFGIGDNGLSNTKKAYLGLQGDFGKVTLGKQGTLWDATQKKADLFNDLGYVNLGLDTADKAINYTSPDMSGFKAGASIVLDGNNTRSKGVDAWEVAAWYENNGIEAGIAYQDLAKNHSVLGVSGQYKNDQFLVAADYQRREINNADANVFGLGGEYYFGQNTIRGNVQYNNDADAYTVGLGYQYNLSKRTYTWVEGQYLNNDGDDAFQTVVGIRHDF